jgi:transcriptional/translational regulatory protein YebC/TACO1
MFDRVCNFKIKTEINLEELELDFIDFGVDEVIQDDDGDVILYSSFENYGSIQKEIESRSIEIVSSEFERIPKQMKELSEEKKEEVNILIEKIEEDDDVQTVFHNMN